MSGWHGDSAALVERWTAPVRPRASRDGPLRRLIGVLFVVLALGVLGVGSSVVMLGYRFSPVLSGSMRPGIQPGDLVITAPVPVADLREGDVIAFYPPGKTTAVLHRLLSVDRRDEGTWITSKGDANDIADPWGEVLLQGTVTWHPIATIPVVGLLPMSMEGLRGPLLLAAGTLLAVTGIRATRRSSQVMHPRAAGGG